MSMNLEEIKSELKAGKKIKAVVNCDGKNYKRLLRLFKTQYSADGFDVVCTTPKYRNYHILSGNEIISLELL